MVRAGSVASAPGTSGATASAPVASTSWSKPSRALVAALVAHGELAAIEVDRRSPSVRVWTVDPALAVLVGRAA